MYGSDVVEQDDPGETASNPVKDTQRDLTRQEIRERLRLVNPELAKDLLDAARAQVQAEVIRHGRLDAKAMSIVTAGGISITVAFSVAGSLSTVVAGYGWLIAMFAAAGVAGLITVLLAVRALLVRGGFAEVSDQAVFDASVLKLADEPEGVDDLRDKEGRPDRKEINAFGAAIYKQHMTAHLWDVYVKDHAQVDKKADMVRDAQAGFMTFLVMIFACEMSLFTVIYGKDAGEAARPEPAAAEGAKRRQGLAAAPAASAQAVAPDAQQASQASTASAARPAAKPGSGQGHNPNGHSGAASAKAGGAAGSP